MTSFYTGVLALTIFEMVIMCLVARANHTMAKTMKVSFTAAFITVIIGALFEWGAVHVQETSNLVLVHNIFKTTELCIAPAIPLMLFPAICKSRKIYRVMSWIVVINVIIEVLSSIFGFVFYVDAANVYHHGPYYFLYMASYGIEGVLLVIGSLLTYREYQSRSAKLMVLEIIFVFFGIALQMADKTIRVDYLAIAIGLSFFYIGYQDVMQSTDSLTKLLNRHSYDNMLGSLEEPVILINIDLDDFKRCNDVHGHPYGDKCLSIVASVIWENFSKCALSYRIGGDEFCILMKPDYLPDAMLSKLHLAMGKRRETETELPTISTGYAYYDPAKQSAIEAVEKADIMMYKFKNIRKQKLALGESPSYEEIQGLVMACGD